MPKVRQIGFSLKKHKQDDDKDLFLFSVKIPTELETKRKIEVTDIGDMVTYSVQMERSEVRRLIEMLDNKIHGINA